MIVALYARSAVNNQDAINAQIASMECACSKQGHAVAGHYADNGISGNSDVSERPAMRQLLDDIDTKGIDAIMAVSPDRLARDFNKLSTFHKLCDRINISIIHSAEPIKRTVSKLTQQLLSRFKV